jgi:hypothetical protein
MAGELQILQESKNLSSIIEKIKKDCKPFLKHNTLLFRGMEKTPTEGEKKVRKDRKPKDSNPCISRLIDLYFKENNLIQRKESLFASKEQTPQMEHWYGPSYYIFPKGKIKMMSSSVVEDLTVQLSELNGVLNNLDEFYKEKQADMKNGKTYNSYMALLKKWIQYEYDVSEWQGDPFYAFMNDGEWSIELEELLESYKLITNLKQVKNTHAEIAIDCDSYYFIKKILISEKELEKLIF